MTRIKWEGSKIEEERIALEKLGNTSTQIAEILSKKYNIKITKDMINGRKKTCNKKNKTLFDEDLYGLKDIYVLSEKTKKDMKSLWKKFQTNTEKKILCLSDLHAPYINFSMVEKAINDNLDCNICVLNGDIFDASGLSLFDKMKEINLKKEFEQVFKLLDVLSEKFEYVIWVWGNHDGERFRRYIVKNIKNELREYAFDRLNPIKYLTEKYDNILTINHNTVQIGDVIFKHPNRYSNAELKTVINEYLIFSANKKMLPNPNFRAIVIGHTHYMGNYIYNDTLLIEQGCLCYQPDYKFIEPSKRSWTTGYARIELDKNNKVIFNKSKWIYLE